MNDVPESRKRKRVITNDPPNKSVVDNNWVQELYSILSNFLILDLNRWIREYISCKTKQLKLRVSDPLRLMVGDRFDNVFPCFASFDVLRDRWIFITQTGITPSNYPGHWQTGTLVSWKPMTSQCEPIRLKNYTLDSPSALDVDHVTGVIYIANAKHLMSVRQENENLDFSVYSVVVYQHPSDCVSNVAINQSNGDLYVCIGYLGQCIVILRHQRPTMDRPTMDPKMDVRYSFSFHIHAIPAPTWSFPFRANQVSWSMITDINTSSYLFVADATLPTFIRAIPNHYHCFVPVDISHPLENQLQTSVKGMKKTDWPLVSHTLPLPSLSSAVMIDDHDQINVSSMDWKSPFTPLDDPYADDNHIKYQYSYMSFKPGSTDLYAFTRFGQVIVFSGLD